MTLGRAPDQGDLLRSTVSFCDGRLSPTSIYGLLFRECHQLFPDNDFADLYEDIGRRSVPPRIVAVVMVLQRLEGLSDREAVDRFTFDARWKYAAGGLDFEHEGFVHTVLVDMRARLRGSERPDRIFQSVLEVAKKAGMVGRRRVLDSTPLYDAVATQDTVTMIRSAIRGLLRVAGEPLATELRGVLTRDDDYAAAGKPMCDWDDKVAREVLVDALARDAYAVLAHLDGRELGAEVKEAAALVATVVGQDLDKTEDGRFRIAKRVAPDRVISTVDPEARHGHKTAARGFDGYKGHLAIDPDSEIITSTEVTAGNVADGAVTRQLLEEILPTDKPPSEEAPPACEEPSSTLNATASAEAMEVPEAAPSSAPIDGHSEGSCATADVTKPVSDEAPPACEEPSIVPNAPASAEATEVPEATPSSAPIDGSCATADVTKPACEEPFDALEAPVSTSTKGTEERDKGMPSAPVEVYGDASYGTADVLNFLEEKGAVPYVKVQAPSSHDGLFTKDAFRIDLANNTVTCPNDRLVQIRLRKDGSGLAAFGVGCKSCPLAPLCTTSKDGRNISLHKHERQLSHERTRQKNPTWRATYKAIRPKVERKIAHMMRRRHGGRRARVRGRERVGQDFSMLAAAINLQRLAKLEVHLPHATGSSTQAA